MEVITKRMVHRMIQEFVQSLLLSAEYVHENGNRRRLETAAKILEEIVTKRDFPEFITTYLYEEHIVRVYHDM